jgi:serine phosphatase RsbU (regulator of sigma subunit)
VDPRGHPDLMEIAGAQRPRPGEARSGDAWLHLAVGDRNLILLLDALGHGEEAAKAASAAVEHLQASVDHALEPEQLPDLGIALHERLRRTRGAVAAILLLDPLAGRLEYLAAGNIAGHLLGSQRERLISQGGLLGGRKAPRLVLRRAPLDRGTLLILHTDGIAEPIPDQLSRLGSCQEIARAVLEACARVEDDAAVVVARWRTAA